MKLIIPAVKTVWFYSEPGSTEEDNRVTADEFHGIHTILDDLGVTHSYDVRDDACSMTIYEQKVSLDEYYMNELFYNGLHLFDFEICYAALGGNGCEFAVKLTWK